MQLIVIVSIFSAICAQCSSTDLELINTHIKRVSFSGKLQAGNGDVDYDRYTQGLTAWLGCFATDGARPLC